MEKLIESARLAPSACNSQPWFYYVAESPEKVRAIAAASQELGMNGFVKNVPAFVVVAEDKPNLTERIGMRLKDQDFASLDLGLSVSQLILRAAEEGLSTCMIGMFSEKAVKEAVGAEGRVRLVVAVGYAAEGDPVRVICERAAQSAVRQPDTERGRNLRFRPLSCMIQRDYRMVVFQDGSPFPSVPASLFFRTRERITGALTPIAMPISTRAVSSFATKR